MLRLVRSELPSLLRELAELILCRSCSPYRQMRYTPGSVVRVILLQQDGEDEPYSKKRGKEPTVIL